MAEQEMFGNGNEVFEDAEALAKAWNDDPEELLNADARALSKIAEDKPKITEASKIAEASAGALAAGGKSEMETESSGGDDKSKIDIDKEGSADVATPSLSRHIALVRLARRGHRDVRCC